MFESFSKKNVTTSREVLFLNEHGTDNRPLDGSIEKLFSTFGGATIERGLFRFHTVGSSVVWSKNVGEYFKDYDNKFQCFGFDWMGRQYGRSVQQHNLIYLFDPATGEALEQEQTLENFLDEDLVDYKNELLNESLYQDVLKRLKTELTLASCFGFKKPLFLGGQDVIENYELADMAVYWSLNGQIYHKIKDLPEGTSLGQIMW